MAQKYPGLYLYYDWLDALEVLPAETAMRIIKNLRAYAEKDMEPEPLEGVEGIVQNMLLASMKRTKKMADYGRAGAQKRLAAARPTTETRETGDDPVDAEATPEEVALLQGAIRRSLARQGRTPKSETLPSYRTQ